MSEYLETKWREISASVAATIPDNADADYDLRELYQKSGESPRGCTAVYNNEFVWQCKMYIGGKQRVLGVGSCYQCAVLYDAAYWRWQQYRTRKLKWGKTYNFSETIAAANNTNADFLTILGQFEDLLRSHNLLKNAEQRAAEKNEKKSSCQSARTAKGLVESLSNNIVEMTELISLEFEKINRRLDELSKRKAPGDITFIPHNVPTLPHYPSINPGPGYTAPVIGDDPNAPTITCQNPNHSSGGILITPERDEVL